MHREHESMMRSCWIEDAMIRLELRGVQVLILFTLPHEVQKVIEEHTGARTVAK